MIKGEPLSRFEIEELKRAGDGFAGEKRQEMIALAALARFKPKGNTDGLPEITVFDVTGTQEYFRLGARGRHKILGVHVHMPYAKWDEAKGWAAGPTKAAQNNVVALVGDKKRTGTVDNYVGVLLKALEQGQYKVGFVDR
jgi:hypothetical protein